VTEVTLLSFSLQMLLELALLLCTIAVGLVICLRTAAAGRDRRAASRLTPAYISRAIQHLHPRCTVESVSISRIARCGDGKASTSDRVELLVRWTDKESQAAAGVPERMILKCSLLPSVLRLGASPRIIAATGHVCRQLARVGLDRCVWRLMNLYHYYFPHAPDAMYYNETLFYRMIRPELSPEVAAPAVYGTLLDESRADYGILMQDVKLAGASFPTAVDELSLLQMTQLLRSYAALHASFWESSRFERDLRWVPTVHANGMAPMFDAIGFGLIRDHVAAHQFERDALAPLGRTVEQLWAGLKNANVLLGTPPVTLCHGDSHIANTYILPDGTVGLFDWQLMIRASWARDVSYILGTALPPALRKRHERALLGEYLKQLSQRLQANQEQPQEEEAWQLYCRAMAWGLVIGWLICPPVNYGQKIWMANVNRLVAACVDLRTFDLLHC